MAHTLTVTCLAILALVWTIGIPGRAEIPRPGDLEQSLGTLSSETGLRLEDVQFTYGGKSVIFRFTRSSGKPLAVTAIQPFPAEPRFAERFGNTAYPVICVAPTADHFFCSGSEWFRIVAPGSEFESLLLHLVSGAAQHAPANLTLGADLLKLQGLLEKRETSWDAINWNVISRERSILEKLKAELLTSSSIAYKDVDFYWDGGSIGFQMQTSRGSDFWVLIDRSIARKGLDQAILLSHTKYFKISEPIPEHGKLTAKLFGLVKQAADSLPANDVRAIEMNRLAALLKDRKASVAEIGKAAMAAKYPPPVSHPPSPELAAKINQFSFTPSPEMLIKLKETRMLPAPNLIYTVAQLPKPESLNPENINGALPEILETTKKAGVLDKTKPSALYIFASISTAQDRYEIVSYEQTKHDCSVQIEHSYPKTAPAISGNELRMIVIPMGIITARSYGLNVEVNCPVPSEKQKQNPDREYPPGGSCGTGRQFK